MCTIWAAHTEGQSLFKLPNIVNDQEHLACTNRYTNGMCPRFIPTQGCHLSLRDTQEQAPTAQQTRNIRIWPQASPQDPIAEIGSHFRVMGQGNRKGCFPNTRKTIESSEC